MDIEKHKIPLVLTAAMALLVLLAGTMYVLFTAQSKPKVASVQTTQLPANPAVIGTLQSATASSITLMLPGGAQTFTVAANTTVVSQVKSGEVGKYLTEIATGTQVLVQPSAADKSAAQSISTLTPPVINNANPLGPPVALTGTVVSTTTTSITVAASGNPNLRVTVNKDTAYVSHVLAGMKGKGFKDLTVGMYVQIQGITTAKGVVAGSIQLVIPLP